MAIRRALFFSAKGVLDGKQTEPPHEPPERIQRAADASFMADSFVS